MSQIIEFQLVQKDGTVEELKAGDCSASVYMAVFDFLETEYDIDCYENPVLADKTMDGEGYLFVGAFLPARATEILRAFAEEELTQTASSLATDWDLETKYVLQGLRTLQGFLEQAETARCLQYFIY